MAETSGPWDGTTVGDATIAPFDGPTEWAAMWRTMLNMDRLVNNGGVAFKVLNSYALSISGANINVDTGRAVVYGTWAQNSTVVAVAIPTPGGASRQDRIVLRKDWVAQTVRITRIAGIEGAGTPEPLVQVAGTTWDIPLGVINVTTGGVITILPEGNAGGGVSYPGRLWYPVPNTSVPQVSAVRTTNQAISSGTRWNIAWESVLVEEIDNMWDIGTPERITVTTPGYYSVDFVAYLSGAAFAGPADITLLFGVSVAIANYFMVDNAAIGTATQGANGRHLKYSGVLPLNAGDYLAFGLLHAGGADATVVAQGGVPAPRTSPRLSVRYLGPFGVT